MIRMRTNSFSNTKSSQTPDRQPRTPSSNSVPPHTPWTAVKSKGNEDTAVPSLQMNLTQWPVKANWNRRGQSAHNCQGGSKVFPSVFARPGTCASLHLFLHSYNDSLNIWTVTSQHFSHQQKSLLTVGNGSYCQHESKHTFCTYRKLLLLLYVPILEKQKVPFQPLLLQITFSSLRK